MLMKTDRFNNLKLGKPGNWVPQRLRYEYSAQLGWKEKENRSNQKRNATIERRKLLKQNSKKKKKRNGETR